MSEPLSSPPSHGPATLTSEAFRSLPRELFFLMASFVGPKTLYHLCLVSHDFLSLCRPLLYRDPIIDDLASLKQLHMALTANPSLCLLPKVLSFRGAISSASSQEMVQDVVIWCKNVVRITYHDFTPCLAFEGTWLVMKARDLRSLNLVEVKPGLVSDALRAFPKLRDFDFWYPRSCFFQDVDDGFINPSGFQHHALSSLRLGRLKKITARDLLWVFSACSNLQAISLESFDGNGIDIEGIREAFQTAPKSLSRIRVSWPTVSGSSLSPHTRFVQEFVISVFEVCSSINVLTVDHFYCTSDFLRRYGYRLQALHMDSLPSEEERRPGRSKSANGAGMGNGHGSAMLQSALALGKQVFPKLRLLTFNRSYALLLSKLDIDAIKHLASQTDINVVWP